MSRDSAFLSLNKVTEKEQSKPVDNYKLTASKLRERWIDETALEARGKTRNKPKPGAKADGPEEKEIEMSIPEKYHTMFTTQSTVAAHSVWGEMTAALPDDFMRRGLLRLCCNAEAFLSVRSEFARSLAVSSVFCYVLGIGDRHLDNILVDVSSGSLVQIDFGCCFGMGASVLGVPELQPFRLSPQLQCMLQPLDGNVLLRRFMLQTMTCLREEEGRTILTNALNVYLQDPVLDWLQGPLNRDSELASLREDVTWEPRRRIDSSLRKLRGVHPATVLIDDLSQNTAVKKFGSLKALEAIVCANACLPETLFLTDQHLAAVRSGCVSSGYLGGYVGTEFSDGSGTAVLTELEMDPTQLLPPSQLLGSAGTDSQPCSTSSLTVEHTTVHTTRLLNSVTAASALQSFSSQGGSSAAIIRSCCRHEGRSDPSVDVVSYSPLSWFPTRDLLTILQSAVLVSTP